MSIGLEGVRDRPVLEPDLSLAFIHAQFASNISATCRRGAVVGRKEFLELHELF